MSGREWFLVAIAGWAVVWMVLEVLHKRHARKRDRYYDVNTPR